MDKFNLTPKFHVGERRRVYMGLQPTPQPEFNLDGLDASIDRDFEEMVKLDSVRTESLESAADTAVDTATEDMSTQIDKANATLKEFGDSAAATLRGLSDFLDSAATKVDSVGEGDTDASANGEATDHATEDDGSLDGLPTEDGPAETVTLEPDLPPDAPQVAIDPIADPATPVEDGGEDTAGESSAVEGGEAPAEANTETSTEGDTEAPIEEGADGSTVEGDVDAATPEGAQEALADAEAAAEVATAEAPQGPPKTLREQLDRRILSSRKILEDPNGDPLEKLGAAFDVLTAALEKIANYKSLDNPIDNAEGGQVAQSSDAETDAEGAAGDTGVEGSAAEAGPESARESGEAEQVDTETNESSDNKRKEELKASLDSDIAPDGTIDDLIAEKENPDPLPEEEVSIQEDIDELGSKIDELSASVTELDSQIRDLESQMTDAEGRGADKIQDQIDDLTDEKDLVQKKIDRKTTLKEKWEGQKQELVDARTRDADLLKEMKTDAEKTSEDMNSSIEEVANLLGETAGENPQLQALAEFVRGMKAETNMRTLDNSITIEASAANALKNMVSEMRGNEGDIDLAEFGITESADQFSIEGGAAGLQNVIEGLMKLKDEVQNSTVDKTEEAAEQGGEDIAKSNENVSDGLEAKIANVDGKYHEIVAMVEGEYAGNEYQVLSGPVLGELNALVDSITLGEARSDQFTAIPALGQGFEDGSFLRFDSTTNQFVVDAPVETPAAQPTDDDTQQPSVETPPSNIVDGPNTSADQAIV